MLALVQWSITTLAAPVRLSGFSRVSCQGQLKTIAETIQILPLGAWSWVLRTCGETVFRVYGLGV